MDMHNYILSTVIYLSEEDIVEKDQEKKITITPNGPYAVAGNIPLNQAVIAVDANGDSAAWKKGQEYKPEEETYYLCRCGHSDKKPYCDGNHEHINFKGREHADRIPYVHHAQLQPGESIDLLDDSSLCVGARFCDRGDTVWRLVEESGNPEKRRQAIEEACNCPAGRLTAINENGQMLEPRLDSEISLVEDPVNNCRGPLWVKGRIRIEGAGGEGYEIRNRVALCRCGESRNQPYCDASHYDCHHMRGMDK